MGHFRGHVGSVIANRYRIVRQVGLGTFGRVVECWDLHGHGHRRLVAIKIVRQVARYAESAVVEARIVSDLNRRGGRGCTHCVVLHQSFFFQNHYCLVFENLGPSLYDFLQRHHYRAFPMVCIRDFCQQLLEALEFLHSFGLIHTDLKMENILLMDDREVLYQHPPASSHRTTSRPVVSQYIPASTRIKVIDFGGACYDTKAKSSSIINTRQYRAPEVILGTGWSMPSDMWSAGCIFAELARGELLFGTHDNIEHLALMERIIGPFPRRLLSRAAQVKSWVAAQAFDGPHHAGARVLSRDSVNFVAASSTLEQLVPGDDDAWFLSILRRLLVLDPDQRATAYECRQLLCREPRLYY
jgi:serine/threonine protein kinase